MRKNIFLGAVAILLTATVTTLHSQVTIGADNVPQSFSVLELISNNTMGLRLPQLTMQQRDALQATFGAEITGKAMGLQIFNTKTKCVETWNGMEWIQTCPPSGPAVPPVSPSPASGCVITPSTGNNNIYTAKEDPNAEAYEFFVGSVSQGELAGNVFEWCWNWFDERPPIATPSGDVASTPISYSRIVRGGYWNYPSTSSRVSYPTGGNPFVRNNGYGFRVVVAP
jgi:hypothetical protein